MILALPLASTGNPVVNLVTGLPSSFPFTVTVDYGVYSGSYLIQETLLVSAVTNNGNGTWTLTVTRGWDGSTAQSHLEGANIVHDTSGQDANDTRLHIDSSAGVHGLAGTVVGTTDAQTLTNKTLTGALVTADPITAMGVADKEYVDTQTSNAITTAESYADAVLISQSSSTETLSNKTLSGAVVDVDPNGSAGLAVADVNYVNNAASTAESNAVATAVPEAVAAAVAEIPVVGSWVNLPLSTSSPNFVERTGYTSRYRKTTEGEVLIQGEWTCTSCTGTQALTTALPTAYRPTYPQDIAATASNAGGTVGACTLNLGTNGVATLYGLPAASVLVHFCGKFPLT